MRKLREFQVALDMVFSEYIRLRDTGPDGNGYCISCGTHLHYSEGQCGHFISRGNMSTRYCESNNHMQCPTCNEGKDGNIEAYSRAIEKKYGDRAIEELTITRHQILKLSRPEYQDLIKYYKEAVKLLKKIKKAGEHPPAIIYKFDSRPHVLLEG